MYNVRTVLNIWGVMLFLRMGWMTALSIVIVLVSTLVTLCSAISMSAICTNGEIGTGGIYYMISRSLGAEAGSMIGIIFSFANAVLVSANLIGAAETAVEIIGDTGVVITNSAINDTRLIAALLLVLIAIIPLIGMSWEARAMLLLMVLLFISLINYFGKWALLYHRVMRKYQKDLRDGVVISVANKNLYPNWNGENFFNVFGVFFPSVIGIFAGASMSGDLKDPNEAIPKGTFLAIITTSSVYLILILCLGFTVHPYASGNIADINFDALECAKNNTCSYGLIPFYQTMTLSSGYGPLIWVGIFAATLSSALGSYVCAPRIFQALCEDNLFPYIKYFAKGYGEINDPRRGYILTFIIALAFIAIGDLNSIAPIISNFFMASFFLVNIASFHASFVGSPSFRPTFKYYNQWISLAAGIVCIVIMFLLDYISAIVTVVIMGVIFLWMIKKGPDVNWGTSKRAHIYNSALNAALKLNSIGDHVKNFRPSILLMTGNPSARIPLVEFANNITKHKSLLLIAHIVNDPINHKIRERVISSQYDWMTKRKIKAFYLLLESNSLKNGFNCMVQIAGLGRKLRPNILMLGYKSSWRDCLPEDLIDYHSVILIQEGLDYADFFDSGLIPNDAIEAMNQFNEKQRRGTIDIWLLADDGGLTLMVPYLLSLNDIWSNCSLRILTMSTNSEEISETKENLNQLMSKLRIPCSEIRVFAESDLETNNQSEQKSANKISVTREELFKYREVTNRYLKLRQLLIENSVNTTLLVMTLPTLNKDIPIPLYMCWLEVLTDLTDTENDHFYRMPPFLLLRGFGQRVITRLISSSSESFKTNAFFGSESLMAVVGRESYFGQSFDINGKERTTTHHKKRSHNESSGHLDSVHKWLVMGCVGCVGSAVLVVTGVRTEPTVVCIQCQH
ncbi:unnamed protein product [Medioppia subpectinata]|uniref:Solute carrier family 12 member 3 n=1 Tax=Medioppia subpectinata TaxID=1979941 RepID=A0A7R9Q092_9ACAR|nr:unnamed protein product [Medioppia subpectinata]CAG2107808.1 unnamed protein product [Medioppia subpectinata]